MADEPSKTRQPGSADADAQKIKDIQPKSVTDNDAESVKGGLGSVKWAKKDL